MCENFDLSLRCIKTVATPPLEPLHKYNQSHAINVGSCDKGPLEFNISYGYRKVNIISHRDECKSGEDASSVTKDT